MSRFAPSYRIGDPCPACGVPLERRANMFYWRGTFSDGAVCPANNALWPITGEEMGPLRPLSIPHYTVKAWTHVVGRGMIATVDFGEFDVPGPNVGDLVKIDDMVYRVRGVERNRTLSDPPRLGPLVGLLVDPAQDNDP